MTDAKPNEKENRNSQEPEERALRASDAKQLSSPNLKQFESAIKSNSTFHNGSAGGAALDSIQIHMGDGRVASRLSPLTEGQLTRPKESNSHTSISLTELLEKQEKEKDPVAQALVSEYEKLLSRRQGSDKAAFEKDLQDRADQAYNRGTHSGRNKMLQFANDVNSATNEVIAQSIEPLSIQGGELSAQVLAQDIGKHAKALGELHKNWWRNDGKDGEIRKCNLFADRVFRDMHVKLPWDSNHIPPVREMIPQLANSSDWILVSTDKHSAKSYKPQPGDFVLWNKTVRGSLSNHPWSSHIEHCGVIGNEGAIHYAGSPIGYRESDFNLMSQAVTFTFPSVIYRSKHVCQ